MRILIDCDTGIDDAVALLYLAACPERCSIAAVGTVHGNVPAPVAADNTLRVLELGGLPRVPVAVGAPAPMAQPLHTAEFVHGADGLGGRAGAAPSQRPVGGSAVEQLVTAARREPGQITVLALGPLTNLGMAVLLEPELPRLLHRVVVMGGVLQGPGNATAQADANIWHDPEAADLVLGAGFDLTLVPLDATESAPADAAWLESLAAEDGARARFVAGILEHYVRIYTELTGRRHIMLHDPLTAAVAVDPGVAEYRDLSVRVELRGEHTRGRTVTDLRGLAVTTETRPPVRVVTSLDGSRLLRRVLDSIRG